MNVRRKVPMSDEAVNLVAEAANLPADYIRATNPPLYTQVERVVFDRHGEPQVKTTTCCCGAPGGMRRICARVSGNRTPCRCACHARGAA